MKYNLNVCIPCRDRTVMTEKCIESIHQNTQRFDKVNIYVFDNLSNLTLERFTLFKELLEDKKIIHYSYDTVESTHRCFSKSIIFTRFIKMMNMKKDAEGPPDNEVYMLSDNDMLYGPKFDEYFISALEHVKNKNPQTHYLVNYPGGIMSSGRSPRDISTKFKNIFTEEVLEMRYSVLGGSGFWLADYNMLNKLAWGPDDFKQTKNKFKHHDTTTWNKIKRNMGNSNYNAAVIGPKDHPLVLHLGGFVGSACNILTRYGEVGYDKRKKELEELERIHKQMTVDEMYETYRTKEKAWRW